jgi:RimJ/RimL family protein N-acetyltransferase
MKPIAANVNGHDVVARELRESDLDALVAYWHESPPDYLASLGVDLAKLGSPEQTRARLAGSLDGDGRRTAITVVAEVGGQVVAYTNMRAIDDQTACAHLHTLVRDETVTALVYELFGPVIAAVLEALEVSHLRFETSVENRGINKYLESFGLQPKVVQLENPDGLARPGQFKVYEFDARAAVASGQGA